MASARLSDILIDDVTWGCATRLRRQEWRQTIADLTDESSFSGAAGPLRAYVTVHKDGVAVVLHDPGGRQVGHLEVSEVVLGPVVREYIGIIREMERSRRGQNSPQLEALDIAKRLCHDDAAEILQRHFRDAQPDHQTARRLFTLLVVLVYDTTRLIVPAPT